MSALLWPLTVNDASGKQVYAAVLVELKVILAQKKPLAPHSVEVDAVSDPTWHFRDQAEIYLEWLCHNYQISYIKYNAKDSLIVFLSFYLNLPSREKLSRR